MSYSKLQPSVYSPSQNEKQLLNSIFTNHDLICGCPEPSSHITWLLIKKCNPKDFSSKETEEIKQWCGTLTATNTGADADTGLEEGELEKLFEEKDITEG